MPFAAAWDAARSRGMSLGGKTMRTGDLRRARKTRRTSGCKDLAPFLSRVTQIVKLGAGHLTRGCMCRQKAQAASTEFARRLHVALGPPEDVSAVEQEGAPKITTDGNGGGGGLHALLDFRTEAEQEQEEQASWARQETESEARRAEGRKAFGLEN
jgi:hypothetical protein|eukprot:COSAG01_NODE_1198_length_11294_cov_16.374632_6_plen_156_part_00